VPSLQRNSVITDGAGKCGPAPIKLNEKIESDRKIMNNNPRWLTTGHSVPAWFLNSILPKVVFHTLNYPRSTDPGFF
jgi:hypothetical protein